MSQFERYAEVYETINKKKPYKKEIGFVYRWANSPKNILDLGCGTAHYWQYFPKSVAILGVEKSEQMISRSKYKDRILHADICDLIKAEEDLSFQCVTALFDVVNYMPTLDWMQLLPLDDGGCFIFDVWDAEKAERDGFSPTMRSIDGVSRVITPFVDGKEVHLHMDINTPTSHIEEKHIVFLHTKNDIISAMDGVLRIVDVKSTNTWQTWYRAVKL